MTQIKEENVTPEILLAAKLKLNDEAFRIISELLDTHDASRKITHAFMAMYCIADMNEEFCRSKEEKDLFMLWLRFMEEVEYFEKELIKYEKAKEALK